MSTSVSWAVRTKRVVLPLVCAVSAAGAVAAQFAPSHLLDIRSATTPQLIGVLLLLALPIATLAAIVTERRFRPRARAAETETTAVPVLAPIAVTTEAVSAADVVLARSVASPAARQHAPAARPRISVVIETKPPQHQVYTLTASPRTVRAA